jgi:hypothetical protein
MQMALIIERDAVRLYNILSKSWEPEKLEEATAGRQWLCTPCRTALLAVRHEPLGWTVDAYALEAAGEVQPLFTRILHDQVLPDDMARMPVMVRRFSHHSCAHACRYDAPNSASHFSLLQG